MISYEQFCKNCNAVEERVSVACTKACRKKEDVTILPVTKNHPVEAPLYSFRRGFIAVGENRVKEAIEKKSSFETSTGTPKLLWELIGHLQGNKVRHAVETFGRIQSVDSVTLAQKLDRVSEELGREQLPILLQANPGNDPAKFGTANFDTLRSLAETAFAGTHLKVEGLMCVAPIDDDSLETAARAFNTLREWRDKLEIEFGKKLPELSMGMTHDLDVAIAAGSTMIRVGTALFGERDYGVKN